MWNVNCGLILGGSDFCYTLQLLALKNTGEAHALAHGPQVFQHAERTRLDPHANVSHVECTRFALGSTHISCAECTRLDPRAHAFCTWPHAFHM